MFARDGAQMQTDDVLTSAVLILMAGTWPGAGGGGGGGGGAEQSPGTISVSAEC